MTTRLEIRLIGEFAVLRDGEPVPLPPSRKTRALLAYLILNPGPRRREQLCEIFWQVPDDPRGSLRWSLSKLRALLNDSSHVAIRADRDHVEFDATGIRIDYCSLRDTLRAGPERVADEQLQVLAKAFSQELLEGLELSNQPAFESFRLAAREEARRLRVALLRRLTSRLREQPEAASRWLEQLAELEPYDLETHCQLIANYAQCGRRSEAERQKALSRALFEDIPGVDLGRLHRAAHAKPQAAVSSAGAVATSPRPSQEVRFCKAADGVQIAYASVGEGPPLIKAANWLNHLEFDWESPVWRHIFDGLTDGRRLIRYDARGNGLSDWEIDDYSFESMVSDLEAVVEASGVDRFPLLGMSQGCAICVEYAVRHPERVTRLVLLGGYARGWRLLGSREIERQTEAMITLVQIGWGRNNPAFRQLFTSLFMPDAPPENQEWFNELQHMTTSPRNAARLMRALGEVDIRDRLAGVRAPTLVMHAKNDLRVSYQAGRELAGGIPGARFVTLNTRNHIMPADDPAWPRMLAELNAFLAE